MFHVLSCVWILSLAPRAAGPVPERVIRAISGGEKVAEVRKRMRVRKRLEMRKRLGEGEAEVRERLGEGEAG